MDDPAPPGVPATPPLDAAGPPGGLVNNRPVSPMREQLPVMEQYIDVSTVHVGYNGACGVATSGSESFKQHVDEVNTLSVVVDDVHVAVESCKCRR